MCIDNIWLPFLLFIDPLFSLIWSISADHAPNKYYTPFYSNQHMAHENESGNSNLKLFPNIYPNCQHWNSNFMYAKWDMISYFLTNRLLHFVPTFSNNRHPHISSFKLCTTFVFIIATNFVLTNNPTTFSNNRHPHINSNFKLCRTSVFITATNFVLINSPSFLRGGLNSMYLRKFEI